MLRCLLQAQLAILQQERDLAFAQNRQLADEIQTIRIYYRYALSFEVLILNICPLVKDYGLDIQLQEADRMSWYSPA